MIKQPILVVEDDPQWQKSFDELVRDAGFVPDIHSTYNEAAAALAQQEYALAVVDISLAFQDHLHRGGVLVLQEIIVQKKGLPAIVVTGYASVELAIEILAGLDDVQFFRKEEFDRRDFIQAIQKRAKTPSILDTLSEREREVLALLREGKTNNQIAADLFVTVNTVKKHTQNIYTKFNVNSRAAAVAKAYEQDR